MKSFVDQPTSQGDNRSLTNDQTEALKTALELMLEERSEHLQQSEELFRTLTGDRAAPGLEREAARRAAEEAFDTIQRVNEAIARIDAGTYGTCVSCQRPIPFERLEALPRTETCVECPDS